MAKLDLEKSEFILERVEFAEDSCRAPLTDAELEDAARTGEVIEVAIVPASLHKFAGEAWTIRGQSVLGSYALRGNLEIGEGDNNLHALTIESVLPPVELMGNLVRLTNTTDSVKDQLSFIPQDNTLPRELARNTLHFKPVTE